MCNVTSLLRTSISGCDCSQVLVVVTTAKLSIFEAVERMCNNVYYLLLNRHGHTEVQVDFNFYQSLAQTRRCRVYAQ
jgi:hypothetical protein